MNIFSAGDVFRFAIRIEEDGELFYNRAAAFADNEDVRRLFQRLADEEVRHKKVFEEMLSHVEENRPPESYQGEYMTYLRAHIDGKAIFIREMKDKDLPEIHDTLAALNFAIQRELDSILYYQEVKQFVSGKNQKFIDQVIEEERKHFQILSEIKKQYT
jgi:rubrerythrin